MEQISESGKFDMSTAVENVELLGIFVYNICSWGQINAHWLDWATKPHPHFKPFYHILCCQRMEVIFKLVYFSF